MSRTENLSKYRLTSFLRIAIMRLYYSEKRLIHMGEKVLLVLGDGMRSDALEASGHPYIHEFLQKSAYDLSAQTVMPSVTLPCHMSLFHSVDPDRHGILTNVYVPQVRPVRGLFETLDAAGKTCSIFYDWEELRDVWRPGHMMRASFIGGRYIGYDRSNACLLEQVLTHLHNDAPDFAFFYCGVTDHMGHDFGWMGEEYLKGVRQVWDDIQKLRQALPDYTIIVTADHGGHGRGHGSDLPEDMTIPVIANGPAFAPGPFARPVNIKDIAPTVAALLGVAADPDWEGRALV